MNMENSAKVFLVTACGFSKDGRPDEGIYNGLWTYYFLKYSWQQVYSWTDDEELEKIFDWAVCNFRQNSPNTPRKYDGDSTASFYLR